MPNDVKDLIQIPRISIPAKFADLDPNPETLADIGKFLRDAAGRDAASVWDQGRALTRAYFQVKSEGLNWLQWTKKEVPHLSQKTIDRYRTVGKMKEKPEGVTVQHVYKQLGLTQGKKKAATPRVVNQKSPATILAEELETLAQRLDEIRLNEIGKLDEPLDRLTDAGSAIRLNANKLVDDLKKLKVKE